MEFVCPSPLVNLQSHVSSTANLSSEKDTPWADALMAGTGGRKFAINCRSKPRLLLLRDKRATGPSWRPEKPRRRRIATFATARDNLGANLYTGRSPTPSQGKRVAVFALSLGRSTSLPDISIRCVGSNYLAVLHRYSHPTATGNLAFMINSEPFLKSAFIYRAEIQCYIEVCHRLDCVGFTCN